MQSADQSVSGHGEMCKCMWSVDHYANAYREMSGHKTLLRSWNNHKKFHIFCLFCNRDSFFVFFIIVALSLSIV